MKSWESGLSAIGAIVVHTREWSHVARGDMLGVPRGAGYSSWGKIAFTSGWQPAMNNLLKNYINLAKIDNM